MSYLGSFSKDTFIYSAQIHSQIYKSVSGQMISDVPIGCFLSGGIDSSLIASIMQRHSSIPINTFSIGFFNPKYNEAKYAKDVSKYLGTNHMELYVSSSDIREIIPKMSKIYSEPFADSSQLPTYIVSKLAGNHVKVVLSGDGGDEVFCGYNRYIMAKKLWPILKTLHPSIKNIIGRGIGNIRPSSWDKYSGMFGYARFGEKIYKLGRAIQSKNIEAFYQNISSNYFEQDSIVLSTNNFKNENHVKLIENNLDDVHYMMGYDALTYLPGDILVKVDRASMANSLETRAPFLDHMLFELAWTMPLHYKIKNGKSKAILREILCNYIPKRLIDRPKMGFAIPVGIWIKKELKDWAEDLLNPVHLKNEGIFDPNIVKKIWDEHKSDKYNHENVLWSILMFQNWLLEN